MATYKRPVVISNNDLAEGVFAASGAAGVQYTADVHPTHTGNHDGPEWRFDVNVTHSGAKGNGSVDVTIVFSTPVTVTDKNKALSYTGDGTDTITLTYNTNKTNGTAPLGEIKVHSTIQPTVVSATAVMGNS